MANLEKTGSGRSAAELRKITFDLCLLLLGPLFVVQPVDQGIGASINRFSVSAGSDESEMFKGNQLLRIEA